MKAGSRGVTAAGYGISAATRRQDGSGVKNQQQPGEQIAVTWDRLLRRPATFVWRRRRYRIERVVQRWDVETGWWNDQIAVSRHYWRVRAGGRLFDLSFDRRARVWRMERCLN